MSPLEFYSYIRYLIIYDLGHLPQDMPATGLPFLYPLLWTVKARSAQHSTEFQSQDPTMQIFEQKEKKSKKSTAEWSERGKNSKNNFIWPQLFTFALDSSIIYTPVQK